MANLPVVEYCIYPSILDAGSRVVASSDSHCRGGCSFVDDQLQCLINQYPSCQCPICLMLRESFYYFVSSRRFREMKFTEAHNLSEL